MVLNNPPIKICNKLIVLLFFVVLGIFLSTEVKAVCYETPGGSSPGQVRISSWLEELESVSKTAKGVELFIDQSSQDHYAKLCNEASQKKYFMSHHVQKKGKWQCDTVCGDAALESKLRNGIMKIRRLPTSCEAGSTSYEFCFWTAK